jgi:hypothetical protein
MIDKKKIWTDYKKFWELSDAIYRDAPKKLKILMKNMGFAYLHAGRHRMTFLAPSATKVYKIPRNEFGIDANKFEARHWNNRKKLKGWKKNIARCKLMKGGILVMEHVVPLQLKMFGSRDLTYKLENKNFLKENKIPLWIKKLECQQAGYTDDGRLVFYDYETM